MKSTQLLSVCRVRTKEGSFVGRLILNDVLWVGYIAKAHAYTHTCRCPHSACTHTHLTINS